MTEAAAAQLTARPSSAADHPLKAILEALGEADREFTDKERRMMFRGHRLGMDLADLLAEIDCRVCRRHVARGERTKNHKSCTIEREKKVVTPIGTGHIDAFHKATRTIFEYLTSTNGSSQLDRKVRQWCIYRAYTQDASNLGFVVLVNPIDLSEERVPVRFTAERRDEVVELMRQVRAGLDGGPLPARVCRKPSDAQSHFCRYADTCFQGWEPPPLEQVIDHEVRVIANQLHAVKETERVQRQHVKITETGRKDLQAELAEHLDYGEYRVGDLKVVRRQVPRETFNFAAARAAGMPEEMIREYSRVTFSDRWDLSGEPDDEKDIPH